MNFSEFKEKLGAEPRKTATEYADDIASDPQWAAAVKEALSLESKLEQTLGSPRPGDEILEGILAVPGRSRIPGPPTWLAIAASLVLVVGLSSVFLWRAPADQSIEEYVRSHYGHDGQSVLAHTLGEQTPADIAAVFASLGVEASPQFAANIGFIKFCPTPEGKGAHMVVSTGQGPATIIYMPSVQIAEPLLIALDNTRASVIGLESGAAAIIGADASVTRQLQAQLVAGLKPMSVDA